MKRLVFLFSILSSLSCFAIDSSDVMTVLNEFRDSSVDGNYQGCYQLMDKSWAGVVSQDLFLASARKHQWKVVSAEMGTIVDNGFLIYAPIKAQVFIPPNKIRGVHEVLFIAKTDSGPRFMNFPFALDDLPDMTFIVVPK